MARDIVYDQCDEFSEHQIDESHANPRSECTRNGKAMHDILCRGAIVEDSLLVIRILTSKESPARMPRWLGLLTI